MSGNQSQLNTLAAQQQQTTDQIYQLITQSSSALTCGPNCQKTQNTEVLRQDYLDAQANVQTAPIQLQEAEQNYYTYTQGTAGYNVVKASSVSQQASALVGSTTTTFQSDVDNATDLTTTYNSLDTTYQKLYDLYEKYLEENYELQMQINEVNTDVITNDRKAYYKGQGYDKLNSWYILFKWIYVFLVFIFILGMLLAGSNYSFMAKFGILIALILYPFVINYIVMFVINFIMQIYSLLPKNAYTTIH